MKKLYIDIETAPHTVYAWGLFDKFVPIERVISPGYTLCFAAKWSGSDEIIFSSLKKDGKKKMLKKIHKLLDEADAVIHYNGKRFDIPTLNHEFVKNLMQPPSPYIQIDLLETVRKQFRLASNKLDYVTKYFGLPGKTSHKGMELWKGCMSGDQDSWNIMEEYNCNDVIILESLYDIILPWIKKHPNEILYKSDDHNAVACCPNCGSPSVQQRGYSYTKTQIYKRFRCNSCGTWSRARSTEVKTKEQRQAILIRDNNS